MADILALTFNATGAVATSAWPLNLSPGKLNTTKLAQPLNFVGLPAKPEYGWRVKPGRKLKVDATQIAAIYGEFAVDVCVSEAQIIEPIIVLSGAGSPVELTLSPSSADPTRFNALMTIRTAGAPVVLSTENLSTDAGPVRMGIWVSGSDAVLIVDGTVVARLRLPRSIPDPKGEISIGRVDPGKQGGVTLLVLWMRDTLDAAQDAQMSAAAASGIGEIDSLIASGGHEYLGLPSGAEQVTGGARWRTFANGNVYWSAATGAHAVDGPILKTYSARGGFVGRLGLPISPDMGLDAVLDWLNAPQGKLSGLVLEDFAKHMGKLKPEDIVIDVPLASKPAKKPRMGRPGWEAFVEVAGPQRAVPVALSKASVTTLATVLGDQIDQLSGVVDGIGRRQRFGVAQRSGGYLVNQLPKRRGTSAFALHLPREILVARDEASPVAAAAFTVEPSAMRKFADALGEQVASGATTVTQAVGLAPGVFLQQPQVSSLIKTLVPDAPLAFASRPTAPEKALLHLVNESSKYKVDFKLADPDGTIWGISGPRAQLFQYGIIITTLKTGGLDLYDDIFMHWVLLGGSRGFLGAPRAAETPITGGRRAEFAGGHVFWSAKTGAHEVHGAIAQAYLAGDTAAQLGFPTTDETVVPGRAEARASSFERGVILWSPGTGAQVLTGIHFAKFQTAGGLGRYGLPTGPASSIVTPAMTLTYQPFELGIIADVPGAATFDSLRIDIAGVAAGNIDDGLQGLLEKDRRAELIVRASITVDGTQIFSRDSGQGGPSWSFTDWHPVLPIRLMPATTIQVHIEAWDWDSWPNADDKLAVHDATYTLADGFFGYAANWGSHVKEPSTWDGGDASATALTFDYTLAPEIELDIDKMRERHFWNFLNKGRDRMPWEMFRGTFIDIAGSEVNYFHHPFESWYYETHYRDVAQKGNCFGFSTTAAEAFLRRGTFAQPLTGYRPMSDGGDGYRTDDELFQHLNVGQGQQKAASVVLWKVFAKIDADNCDPRRVWRRVKATTDTGQPVILSIQADEGGHAVLVYKCTTGANGSLHMYLADSNHPYARDHDSESSRITIAADGSYTVRPSTIPEYAGYAGPQWVEGVLPKRHMIEIPHGTLSAPLRTPVWDIATLIAWGAGGLLTSDGATVDQLAVGGKNLVGDQRLGLLDHLQTEVKVVKAAAKAGLFTGSATVKGVDQDRVELVTREQSRVSAIATLLAPGLSGSRLTASLQSAIAAIPDAELANASWGGVVVTPASSIAAIKKKIGLNVGHAVFTLGASSNVAFIESEEDDPGAPTLIAFRGPIHPDLELTLRGEGGSYRQSMLGRGGLITIDSTLAKGRLDTVKALGLSSLRPGIRMSTTASARVVTVALTTQGAGSTPFGWTVPLGIGAEEAGVRWLAGRPGLAIQHAAAVPAGLLEWASAKGSVRYASPSLAAGENIRVVPNDPASPLGALRLQRRSTIGDLIDSVLIDPIA